MKQFVLQSLNSKKKIQLGLALVLGCCALGYGILSADKDSFMSQAQAEPATQSVSSTFAPRLGDLHTFEMDSYDEVFGNKFQYLDAEYIQHVNNALFHERSLPKASPAEGILHLACVKRPECNDIKFFVTAGWNGPEVWSTRIKRFKFFSTWWLGNIPERSELTAQQLVQQLAEAYRQDQPKNVSNTGEGRIEIPEH